MADQLDETQYYFRIRPNGASVFLLDHDNRQHRLEMREIATLWLDSGVIHPEGDHTLSDAQKDMMAAWIVQRRHDLAERVFEKSRLLIEDINLATQWAKADASPAQLDQITDDLLMAIHDMRAVLVKKLADRMMGGEG